MNNATNSLVCKTCGASVPGPVLFCPPCHRALLDKPIPARPFNPAESGYATRAEAVAAANGRPVYGLRPPLGLGAPRYFIRSAR